MTAIHPTAIISGEARLGEAVRIGPHVVIEGPVEIGRGVRIIAQAYLTGYTTVGEGCEIHPFAAIGGPPQDQAYTGQRSYCRIGARSIIREGVTIHRGTHAESATVIGSDCMLMANAHVAHNCNIGDHVVLTSGVLLAGHVEVGHHAVLGGGCGAHQFVRIGEYAMIGGLARITQDAAPFMSYAERNECLGVNRVGLRRNGFSNEQIDELRTLHRTLFRQGGAMRKAAALRESARTDAGKRLLEFVLAKSKRGIGGRRQRMAKAPTETPTN